MADNKKYYYLKLRDNFFDTDAMVVLESMPDGYLYSNILLKLYLRSLKTDGKLMFNGRIPYNANILAQVTRHNVGVVEKALQIFTQLDLIDILDNGTIYMLDIQNFIGKSSTEADRQRQYYQRLESEKKKSCKKPCKKSTPEIEKEIEIKKKIEIEKELKIEKKKINNPLEEMIISSNLSDTIKEAVRTWLAYKTEKKETYKPTGFKALLTTIANHVTTDGEDRVIDVIQTSMANNWKGIIWDCKINKQKPERDRMSVLKDWLQDKEAQEMEGGLFDI